MKRWSCKKTKFGSSGPRQQKSAVAIEASHSVSQRSARAKEPHTIAEELTLACAKDTLSIVTGSVSLMKSQPLFLLNDTIIRRIQGVIYFSTRCWRNQKFCKRFVQHCNLMSQQMLQIHLSFSFTPGMFTLTIQKPTFCFANLWKLHGLEKIFSKNMSDSF